MTTYTNFELWLILYALKVLNDLSFENLVPHFPFHSMFFFFFFFFFFLQKFKVFQGSVQFFYFMLLWT